jgi:transcriptional regulator with XRE-family HTH domain
MGKVAYVMISSIAPCALRTHRRLWGLSQRELADLLGFESPTHVSRLERGKRTPGLETALACATLFGVSLGELFPQFTLEIEEKLRERLSRLHEGCLHPSTPAIVRKRELVDRALQVTTEEARATLV